MRRSREQKKGKWKISLRRAVRISFRDILIAVMGLILSAILCAGLQELAPSDSFVPLIFVLAVMVVAYTTDGYVLGILTSLVAVLLVNYGFTVPYNDFNFTLSGYPLTFACFLGVSIAISALMSRVRAGEQARIDAERENMRANLLRAISHDLRTPLTTIVGTLNAVTENGDRLTARERHNLLNNAKMDAEWLINMVENLLSITRMESGAKPDLHKEVQVAEEIMGEAVGRFRKQYSKPAVETHVPDEVILIPMDAMLIEQVILNLLINVAIHAKGATRAVLSLTREGNNAAFRVEDNGCGIDDRVMPHLFEGQNYRFEKDRTEDSVRTMGIGLSVCRTIVKAHGGSMTAHNRITGGAVFTFTLPIEEETVDGPQTEDFDH